MAVFAILFLALSVLLGLVVFSELGATIGLPADIAFLSCVGIFLYVLVRIIARRASESVADAKCVPAQHELLSEVHRSRRARSAMEQMNEPTMPAKERSQTAHRETAQPRD